jgi:hypothetical protein
LDGQGQLDAEKNGPSLSFEMYLEPGHGCRLGIPCLGWRRRYKILRPTLLVYPCYHGWAGDIHILDLAILELDLGMGILLVPLTRCLDLRFSDGSLRLLAPPWSCTVKESMPAGSRLRSRAHPRHRPVGRGAPSARYGCSEQSQSSSS